MSKNTKKAPAKAKAARGLGMGLGALMATSESEYRQTRDPQPGSEEPTSISINTVDYQGRRMRVMDNGKGSFSGDIDTTNAGVVDYTTRRGAVTFISPVQPGVPVQVEAAYLASVAKFPQEDRVARVVITIPWEDFLRVSNTGSTIIDSAEAALKYR